MAPSLNDHHLIKVLVKGLVKKHLTEVVLLAWQGDLERFLHP